MVPDWSRANYRPPALNAVWTRAVAFAIDKAGSLSQTFFTSPIMPTPSVLFPADASAA
jgi:hypothetical protein